MILKKHKPMVHKSAFSNKTRRRLSELKGKLLDTSKTYNPELERGRKPLLKWITFMEKVIEYEEEYHLEEAAELAIKYCIDNNIHKDYLIYNSSKILRMLMDYDYNKEQIKRVKKSAKAMFAGL